MKRSMLVLFVGGVVLFASGFFWGLVPVAAVLALLTLGILRMETGILGPVRTKIDTGIALTYDDGPDPRSTPALLDLLKQHGAKATFFVVGDRVRAHPEVVKRCHAEGHTVANHSHHHGTFTNIHFGGWMKEELAACQRAVEEAIGIAPRFYRPPFGLMNPYVEPSARALGMDVVAWSIRSLDTVRDDAAQRVVADLAPGAIVLLHDGGLEPGRVVATTRTILEAAAARGLEPVAL